MIILLLFAFLAGLATIISPCILPLLPVILAACVTRSRLRPLGIITGFAFSFALLTLVLTTLLNSLGLSPDLLRDLTIVFLLFFGLVLFFGLDIANLIQKFVPKVGANLSQKDGFGGGFIIGMSLGPIWTPCAGPILGAVTTLIITKGINLSSALILVSYLAGVMIPMLALAYGSQSLTRRMRAFARYSNALRRILGALLLVFAILLFLDLDKKITNWLYDVWPAEWYESINTLENNATVRNEIDRLLD